MKLRTNPVLYSKSSTVWSPVPFPFAFPMISPFSLVTEHYLHLFTFMLFSCPSVYLYQPLPIFSFSFYFLATPCSTWGLSSPTRDRPCAYCIGRWNLNHWTAREIPCLSSFCQNLIHNFSLKMYGNSMQIKFQ